MVPRRNLRFVEATLRAADLVFNNLERCRAIREAAFSRFLWLDSVTQYVKKLYGT